MIQKNLAKRGAVASLFLILSLLLFINSPKQGDFWWSDASRHAMDGAFFHEFFKDLPLSDPIGYAVDFYIRYPAISIAFYPPLFAVTEGWLFFLAGPSHFSAQLMVTIFYFFLLIGAYRLSSQWLPRIYALTLVLLFAGASEITFWGRQVMLEIPAYTFLIWTAHYFLRYLEAGKNHFLYICSIHFLLGIYTKLNLILMAPVFLFILYKYRNAVKLKYGNLILTLLGAGISLLPLIYVTIEFGQTNLGAVAGGQAVGELKRLSIENWLYYIKAVPGQLGIVNMVLLCAATAALPKAYKKVGTDKVLLWFMGTWLVWGYIFYSLISLKEVRHSIFLIFPLLFLVILILHRLYSRKWFGYALFAAAMINFVGTLHFQSVPYVRNYAEAADYISAELPPGYRVMIHSYWDGNFIFNLWRHQDRRDLAILRSDKFLLKMGVKRSMGVEQKELTEEQMLDMLNDYGVYYVVCEKGFWDDLSIMKDFEKLLNRHFEKVHEILLERNYTNLEKKLIIYRNPKVGSGPFESIRYDLLIIGAEIGDGRILKQ